MKRKNAKDLIDRANKLIGQQISIKILDQKLNAVIEARAVLTGWVAVSLAEDDGKPDVKLYAKLTDVNHSDKIYSPTLKSVVDEFERLEHVRAGNAGLTVAHGN